MNILGNSTEIGIRKDVKKMSTVINKFYRKIANNGNDGDYELVGEIGVEGVPLNIMQGATSSADGKLGLVPSPNITNYYHILRGNGRWDSLTSLLSYYNYIEPESITLRGENEDTLQFSLSSGYDLIDFAFISISFYKDKRSTGDNENEMVRNFLLTNQQFKLLISHEDSLSYEYLEYDDSGNFINNSQVYGKLYFPSYNKIRIEINKNKTLIVRIIPIGNMVID